MKKIKFAIIGCGLMGKEFASAAARWNHLNQDIAAPEIIAVADSNLAALDWFKEKVPSVKYAFEDYRDVLKLSEVQAVYCALPHVLHEEVYCEIIRAKKHLFGEKPFGMDLLQNSSILRAIEENPEVFVRCSSQYPFFPGCQELIKWIRDKKCGRIIEISAGIRHSSDLDQNKPINWKRQREINGEYGCMGDLGIHVEHVPFRLGFIPKRVYAQLSNIITSRPDGKGGITNCDTWDNAILNCDVVQDGYEFPMKLEMKRIAPGSTNEWFLEVYGLESSVKFTTNDPNSFCFTQSFGKEQAWCRVNVGYKPQFAAITGSIFEFGFPDAILQMWAAFMLELTNHEVGFGCFTPKEAALSHALHTAALRSNENREAVEIVC